MQFNSRQVCGHPLIIQPEKPREQTIACQKVLPEEDYYLFMQKRTLRLRTPSLVPPGYRVADVDKVRHVRLDWRLDMGVLQAVVFHHLFNFVAESKCHSRRRSFTPTVHSR